MALWRVKLAGRNLLSSPSRALGPVLQHDACRGQQIANSIRFLPVLRLACRDSVLDQLFDLRVSELVACLRASGLLEPLLRIMAQQAENSGELPQLAGEGSSVRRATLGLSRIQVARD